jgi:hypothetical protein
MSLREASTVAKSPIGVAVVWDGSDIHWSSVSEGSKLME